MEPKKLLTADYLDIIYDHRNKSYGGYELRKHYDRRLRKALLFALTGVAALLSFSFITANHKGAVVTGTVDSAYVISEVILPVVPPPPKPPVLPPSPPPPQQRLRTSSFTEPVIDPTDIVPPDKQMTENKNLANTQPGITSHDGDSTGIEPTHHTGGTGIIDNGLGKSNDPVRLVEQMPQFNGDIGAYLGAHLHYPEAARSSNIEGRVVIEFVVNEDGAVSNAKVVKGIGGGCDDEALRMVNAMPKWKPGKQNGKAVKVYFLLPIVFKLD